MVRKQVCIPGELDEQLESLAAARHVSQASIVRAALEAYVESAHSEHAARVAAGRRFLELAEEISERLPCDYKRLTREELHDRELVRRLERDHLRVREGRKE